MKNEINLQRFIDAQQTDYSVALSEIKNGKKRSHWMWYIFPQIFGLGSSKTSQFYSIKSIKEAEEFLRHPLLGKRLIENSNALLALTTNDAHAIFGSPDDLKLQSSMTLFSILPEAGPVFNKVLEKFFKGKKDKKTIDIISAQG
jgi:uncharacterized protein (DUF1810 family)